MSDRVLAFPVIAVGSEAAAPRRGAPDETVVLRSAKATVLLTEVELHRPFDARLDLLHSPSSPRSTAHRILRHRLMKQGDPRVIVVTSSSPREGKSTCAINLALAIAEERAASVLYLDANRQRPILATLLGNEGQRGVLGAAEQRTYPVVALPGSELRLATVSDSEVDASQPPSILQAVLGDLREAYDYVIVDAGSVLESADVNVLSEKADAVVIAARAGHSHRRALRECLTRLEGAPVRGLVLLDSGV